MQRDLQDHAAKLVKRSRAAQGLPPQLDDPAVFARIAALLAAERDHAAPAGGRRGMDSPTLAKVRGRRCA